MSLKKGRNSNVGPTLLLDRTLVWNQRHLMIVLREYEDFYNTYRPHRTLKQAAPLRPLPDGGTDLDHFRVQRRDRRRDSGKSPGGIGFGTHSIRRQLAASAHPALRATEAATANAIPTIWSRVGRSRLMMSASTMVPRG